MVRVNLPEGCMGFSDGDQRFMAERGAGSFVNLDDTDPVGRRALEKLRKQDYASAGLVDAGPEKFFPVKGPDGKWCADCRFLAHAWAAVCPRCGRDTVPEAEMSRPKPTGQYVP
jgi:hypothetical protein